MTFEDYEVYGAYTKTKIGQMYADWKAERDELKGWNEKRIKHIERLEVEGMALQAEREKLIGALEKIAKLLQVHPEQIVKAAWRYKVYAIVTAALA